MWIAVDEATEENGTMSIIPRSHLGPTLDHRRDEGAEQLITCLDAVDIDEAVPCVLEPGGVVFFCYGVVHGTSRNESSLERSGGAYHFVSSDHIRSQAKEGDQHRQLTGTSDRIMRSVRPPTPCHRPSLSQPLPLPASQSDICALCASQAELARVLRKGGWRSDGVRRADGRALGGRGGSAAGGGGAADGRQVGEARAAALLQGHAGDVSDEERGQREETCREPLRSLMAIMVVVMDQPCRRVLMSGLGSGGMG